LYENLVNSERKQGRLRTDTTQLKTILGDVNKARSLKAKAKSLKAKAKA